MSFATVILAGSFRRIPRDVIDAGRIDGAGRLTLLTSVAIPFVRPGIVAVGLLVAVFVFLLLQRGFVQGLTMGTAR